jgi:hypothetical protein
LAALCQLISEGIRSACHAWGMSDKIALSATGASWNGL